MCEIMGMSTHVFGVGKKDDKWKLMEEIWEKCEKAGVCVPDEVYDFFRGEVPTNASPLIPLNGVVQIVHDNDRNAEIYDVDLSLLPKGVDKIRFMNSF